MAYFKDAGECDDILGGFFRKTSEGVSQGDAELVRIQNRLAEIGLIVKFVWRDPELSLLLDFTQNPFAVNTNDDTTNPTATFTLTADEAHRFWHGKVNLAKALTTKAIVARGPIPKILRLLPTIEPMYKRYPLYLKERGREDLILSS